MNQTIAANLGSMSTPIGNPQNLYLYGKFSLNIGDLVSIVYPYVILSLIYPVSYTHLDVYKRQDYRRP